LPIAERRQEKGANLAAVIWKMCGKQGKEKGAMKNDSHFP
jgi:hypothetical protein